jgi:hypothetical protein
MSKLRYIASLLLVAAPALTVFAFPRSGGAEEVAVVLRSGSVPIGSLGHPLGAYLTIDGARLDGPKRGVSTLLAEAVNGERLAQPVVIWVDNVDLPAGQRCRIKGYETARMIGMPPARIAAEREQGRDAPEPQAAWQVNLYFVALSVVTPPGLAIRKLP